MRLNINPTRMELLKLRRRSVLARRGHKLLKDKQDELMRKFTEMMEENKNRREIVEKALREANRHFINARGIMSGEAINSACSYSGLKTEFSVEQVPLMNLRIPKYTVSITGEQQVYDGYYGSVEFAQAMRKYREVLPGLIKMAEQEKVMQLVAVEIENTRRRVNALEYILIPNLLETIRYISMKLEELERGNITRLMKVKEMIQKTR